MKIGEVVYCSDGISSDTVYAYIINTWIDENGETLYAKLVTAGNMGTLTNRKYWWVSDKLVQNDNVYEYKIADKAKVDGYKITSSLAESIKNKVCEIKVQHSETAGTEITKIDKLVPNFQYTKGKYNHNTSAMIQSDLSLMNYDNPAVLLSGNIKTLVVPVDTAEKYDDDCYMAKYRIENDVSTHNVEFYGIPKDSQTPKLLVMKTVLSEVGTAGGDNETCILTEGVSKGVNEDDEECYFAQAYDKNGNEITLTIRNDFRFADSSVKNAIMDLCAGDVMEIGRDGQNRVLEIKVMASASRPIDGTQMGIIEKLQQNVIWNKSNGDDFYNVFFYMNDDDERVEAGIKAEYPIFRYTQGRNGYVDKIGAADILTDENGNTTGVLAYDDPQWDQLLDQVTLDEAINFVEAGGDDFENIDSIGYPRTYANDGPIGFVRDQVPGYFVKWNKTNSDEPTYVAEEDEYSGYGMAGMPTEPVVAATFNKELVQREGEIFGEDSLWSNIASILGPGLNNHRTPYCGRNHEYYSEDSMLTNLMGVAVCTGGTSKGLMMTPKHFAFNNMELNRSGLSTFMTEQAGREMEFKRIPGRNAEERCKRNHDGILTVLVLFLQVQMKVFRHRSQEMSGDTLAGSLPI